jgi:hypothetical protein
LERLDREAVNAAMDQSLPNSAHHFVVESLIGLRRLLDARMEMLRYHDEDVLYAIGGAYILGRREGAGGLDDATRRALDHWIARLSPNPPRR